MIFKTRSARIFFIQLTADELSIKSSTWFIKLCYSIACTPHLLSGLVNVWAAWHPPEKYEIKDVPKMSAGPDTRV